MIEVAISLFNSQFAAESDLAVLSTVPTGDGIRRNFLSGWCEKIEWVQVWCLCNGNLCATTKRIFPVGKK